MSAELRGSIELHLSTAELEAARRTLAERQRASSRWQRARFVLDDDGRASFVLPMARREIARVAEAVLVAAAVSVGGSLFWDWMFFVSLPIGAAAGVAFAAATVRRDHRRAAGEARALLRGLTLASR